MTYATHLSIQLQTEDDTERPEQDKNEFAEDLWPEEGIPELGDRRLAAIRFEGERGEKNILL